jgi:hypothetical protein
MEQVNCRLLHNMLVLLPLDKFCPLPRLTRSRILCRIRSSQMPLSCPKPPISDALFPLEYEVEFANPGPCFLKQSSATHR